MFLPPKLILEYKIAPSNTEISLPGLKRKEKTANLENCQDFKTISKSSAISNSKIEMHKKCWKKLQTQRLADTYNKNYTSLQQKRNFALSTLKPNNDKISLF